ncbi:hypothetical protein A9Q78_09015 [Methylophaga sp. 41_12_T18]|nr:hypothetical protein A9Q78_09015 [Methylophaga sp. 41_12_T18]
MKKLFILLAVVMCWKFFWADETVVLGPGIKVVEAPIQIELNNAVKIQYKGFQITPLAEFQLTGKILSRKDYSFGRESELSPTDLALGWGPMSDEAVLENIDISQSGRWYRWRVEDFPIPRKAIETNSANMHLVPANDLVASMLELTKQGQIIELTGYLIRVDADDGWHWQSSLTRNDTGGQACELIYVESLHVIKQF